MSRNPHVNLNTSLCLSPCEAKLEIASSAARFLFVKPFGLFLLLSATAFSQSQREMNGQANGEFEKADARLNALYRKTLASLDETGSRKLIASERAWLAFREAEAAYRADAERGGSLAPMVYANTETDLTRQRIRMLQAGE